MELKKFFGTLASRKPNKAHLRRQSSDDDSRQSEESILGFSITKVLDRNSIFCGIPSINAIAQYVEVLVENWQLLPTPKDTKLVARAKMLAIAWKIVRTVQLESSSVLNRDNLVEIDFGESKEVIFDLIHTIIQPDEVLKPRTHLIMNPVYLFRYPIKNGFIFYVVERDSECIRNTYLSKNITKDDVLDFIWQSLGDVVQLEADEEGLTYVAGELSNKKIYGSSNDLILKLQNDYQYFRDSKTSRGYLLIGKPGTGKTGIVNALVNSTDGRVFIISGLDGIGTVEEMESLFIQMKPDFIIFDDCDRSNTTPTFIRVILKMLESVKDKNPHTNFLFTANTFSGILQDEAVTRRGRIDQIYEVPEPNESDRREIFENYAHDMSIDFSDEDLDKAIEASSGMTGADIKELCIQLQRASIDEVFERAKEIDSLKEKYAPNDIFSEDLEPHQKRSIMSMIMNKSISMRGIR